MPGELKVLTPFCCSACARSCHPPPCYRPEAKCSRVVRIYCVVKMGKLGCSRSILGCSRRHRLVVRGAAADGRPLRKDVAQRCPDGGGGARARRAARQTSWTAPRDHARDAVPPCLRRPRRAVSLARHGIARLQRPKEANVTHNLRSSMTCKARSYLAVQLTGQYTVASLAHRPLGLGATLDS